MNPSERKKMSRHVLNYNFLPYVHKAKCLDVAGICMSKQTIQLLPCESQGEQFVQ